MENFIISMTSFKLLSVNISLNTEHSGNCFILGVFSKFESFSSFSSTSEQGGVILDFGHLGRTLPLSLSKPFIIVFSSPGGITVEFASPIIR